MEAKQPKPENIQEKKSKTLPLAARAIAAAGIIAGGTAGLVSQNSTEAATGENSWGARTEQPQQINPTETPEATIIETTPSPTPPAETTPTPTPKKTIDGSWSTTPSPETPPPTTIGGAWKSTPISTESPAQLPQTGGPVSENHRSGITDKLALIAGALFSRLGIGIANKQRSPQK